MHSAAFPRTLGGYRIPDYTRDQGDWERVLNLDLSGMTQDALYCEHVRLQALLARLGEGDRRRVAHPPPRIYVPLREWILARLRVIAEEVKRRKARP